MFPLGFRALGFLTALLFFPLWSARAAVIDEVARDFKPISGYVIMEAEGEYLIDLDAGKGVSAGDLFSVIKPGEKITHPVTGKVLGTLEEVKGILKATRVQEGYSFARLLGKSVEIKRGDPVRRYAGMSAALWDYTGKGETFFFQLRDQLPSLKWQEYSTSQTNKPDQPGAPTKDGPNLIFILTSGGVEARDAEFQLIHTYGPPQSVVSAAPGAAVAVLSKGVPARPELKERVTYEPTYHGYQTIGELSRLTLMADFVKHKGQLLMVTTDGKQVRVFEVSDKLPLIANGSPPGVGSILAVKWWWPSVSTDLHLAVTTMTNNAVASTIFKLQGGKLVTVREWIPFFLGSFDLDKDGVPETLLRQSFDRDIFWGDQIRELLLGNGNLKVAKPKVKLPRLFTVLGSTFADITSDGKLETIIVRDRSLYIYAGTKELYQSSAQIGGSLAMASYELNPGANFSNVMTAFLEISPITADLDGDGRPEVLAISTDRGIVTTPRLSDYGSWVTVVKYKDGEFVQGTLGERLDIPTQGLGNDKDLVLVVASRPGTLFGKKASSRVLAYPLKR